MHIEILTLPIARADRVDFLSYCHALTLTLFQAIACCKLIFSSVHGNKIGLCNTKFVPPLSDINIISRLVTVIISLELLLFWIDVNLLLMMLVRSEWKGIGRIN